MHESIVADLGLAHSATRAFLCITSCGSVYCLESVLCFLQALQFFASGNTQNTRRQNDVLTSCNLVCLSFVVLWGTGRGLVKQKLDDGCCQACQAHTLCKLNPTMCGTHESTLVQVKASGHHVWTSS